MTSQPVPLMFIDSLGLLSWRDVKWGLEHGWLSASDAVAHAMQLVGSGGTLDLRTKALLSLASLDADDDAAIATLVDRLASLEGDVEAAASQEKWMFVILSWIYARRHDLEDPLGLVERIYADFDYPRSMRDFVRYMPPEGGYEPQAHTPGENAERLFRNWATFLATFSARHEAPVE